MTEQERAAIESAIGGVQRAAFDLTIETAEDGGDGRRRIKGVANTFGVMRSGRIILPAAVDAWLRAGGGRVPLLAQHGYVEGFATIGAATLTVAGGKLRFAAELGQDIPLADDAWKLVSQKLLSAVSLGWRGLQARWVRDDDADLDEHVRREMKRSGVREAYAFFQIEPVELSLVDVPDDAGALLAARRDQSDAGPANGALTELRVRIDALEKQLAALTAQAAAATPFGIEAAAIERAIVSRLEGFLAGFQLAAVNAIRQSAELHSAALDAHDAAAGDGVDADGLAELRDIGRQCLDVGAHEAATELATMRRRLALAGKDACPTQGGALAGRDACPTQGGAA